MTMTDHQTTSRLKDPTTPKTEASTNRPPDNLTPEGERSITYPPPQEAAVVEQLWYVVHKETATQRLLVSPNTNCVPHSRFRPGILILAGGAITFVEIVAPPLHITADC
jgi:hypothetical protein